MKLRKEGKTYFYFGKRGFYSASNPPSLIILFWFSHLWSMSYWAGLSPSPTPGVKCMTLAWPISASQIGTMDIWLDPANQRNSWGFCGNHQEKPFFILKSVMLPGATAVISQPRGQSSPKNRGSAEDSQAAEGNGIMAASSQTQHQAWCWTFQLWWSQFGLDFHTLSQVRPSSTIIE